MTAQEFSTRLSRIDSQITALEAEKDKLVKDQMAQIRKDLNDLGLTFGMEVDILSGSTTRHCTFNDVRSNGYYIYLEFCYPHNIGEGFYWKEMVRPETDFIIVLPNTQLDYQKFMSNYQ